MNALYPSILVILSFIKMNYFLRIFDGFSFLVSMLKGVFNDLRYFLAYFLFVMVTFSLIFIVLIPNASESYEGTSMVSFLIIAFRTSLGDFEIDDYKKTDHLQLTWVAWFLLMLIGNVIFMNFIIAVITESFEKCMQTKIAESYRLKTQMIAELESIMLPEELFPRYIVIRKPKFFVDKLATTDQW